jgi:hypothetical protein
MGANMLKEVGASGQISLGKKYAGRLFDVIALDLVLARHVRGKVVLTIV